MSFDIIAIPNFKKEIKQLARKYPSLKQDFSDWIDELKEKPNQGTPLGNNCYKVRMAISSKKKGKSGGARIITHLKVSETAVYLLSIYDKSDKESITNKLIKELLKEIPD